MCVLKPLIQVQKYSFSYPGEDKEALQNISFEIDKPEVILLAGDSGSGKSTFLKSLNGLIPDLVEGKTKGERKLLGKDYEALPVYEISQNVGNVFQNPRSQFFTLNSTAEMVFAMENFGFSKEKMKMRLEELSGEFSLEKILDKEIFSLSSGECQILSLATSLVLKPKILLFDEPSANLDYGNAMCLKKIIQNLKNMGISVIVADHRFYYLNGILDRVFLIQKGKLTIFDREEDFKNSNYDTRSFDLFHLTTHPKPENQKGEIAAHTEKICKRGILEEISLDFYKHEVAVLIGNNGAGKTTFAKILTGGISPDEGKTETKNLPFYIMQDSDYQLFGTSVENELAIAPIPPQKEDIEEVLKKLNLYELRERHPFELSGGEKQRLQIGMALLSTSDLVIFDEPTSGLDVKSMNAVAKCIHELKKTRALIIISHDYEFIRKIADRVIYLKDGKVENDFLLKEENIEQFNQIFKEMEEQYE